MEGKGLQLLDDRLKASNGLTAFDPAALIAIIQAIIEMVQKCRNPNAKALRRRLLNRARLAAAIQKSYPGLNWAQALQEADKVFDLADMATEDEPRMLIDDCCR